MIQIENEKNCCGCGACSIACPAKCITMEERSLGHLFPVVNEEKCLACNKCETVCPMLSEIQIESEFEQEVFAAYAKDNELRFSGSSGGMFGVFSNKLIEQGYIVYGAAFDERMQLKCVCAESKSELKALYKSKYLQSDLRGKYERIKQKLQNGTKVLFISTPCQVRALKAYLVEEYSNLLTIDFICHGVPSQKLFDQCLEVDEKKYNGKIKSYEFRTKKKNGATPHYFTEYFWVKEREKKISNVYFMSPFYAMFQKYINLRESCYQCKFAGKERVSDITIGDFHDIDQYVQGINRFDGVSMVVLNTVKGKKLWNDCNEKIDWNSLNLDKLIADGVCFGSGTLRPDRRDEFLLDYENKTIEELISKWANPNAYWKRRIYYMLPSAIRKIIKKLWGI